MNTWKLPSVQQAYNSFGFFLLLNQDKGSTETGGESGAKSTKDGLVTGAWQRWEGVAAGTEERLPVCSAFDMHHVLSSSHRLQEAGVVTAPEE